tara:strand:- start:644 stop:991 length:348 start_codon:yes stop_codon:yes gene_type:complete
MGSTLEAQKKKAPTPKKQKIVVTPSQPYHSSESLRQGFEHRLPSAIVSAQTRTTSPFGNLSPRAAALDVAAGAVDLFRDEKGKRGSRFAEKASPLIEERDLTRSDGGIARNTRVF